MFTPSARNALDSSLGSLVFYAETYYKLQRDVFFSNFRAKALSCSLCRGTTLFLNQYLVPHPKGEWTNWWILWWPSALGGGSSTPGAGTEPYLCEVPLPGFQTRGKRIARFFPKQKHELFSLKTWVFTNLLVFETSVVLVMLWKAWVKDSTVGRLWSR